VRSTIGNLLSAIKIISQHLDLIAGLQGGIYMVLSNSRNYTYHLEPIDFTINI